MPRDAPVTMAVLVDVFVMLHIRHRQAITLIHNTYIYHAYSTFTASGSEPLNCLHGACRRTKRHARRRAVVAQPAGSEPRVATVAGHVPQPFQRAPRSRRSEEHTSEL